MGASFIPDVLNDDDKGGRNMLCVLFLERILGLGNGWRLVVVEKSQA